jgi:regulator of protease activity HflC (stomatin/prohibitin superfamily)
MSKKEAYEKKVEAKLDEWGAEIDRLKAKSKGAKADAQVEFQEQLEELKTKREAARKKLSDLKNTSGDAWDDVKSGMDSAWQALDKSLESAAQRFQ